ncbi:MAG: hypothetical protein IJ413_04315 [Bacteroides sp.]|nr:hypothetical protein [Bacteroides sp.]
MRTCFLPIFNKEGQATKYNLNVLVIMEKVYAYEAPVVEIIEVAVEKGFADS